MSVRLITLVYGAEIGSIKYQAESGEVRTLSQPDKAVLLAMADCAADDGSSVFLGVESLTWKTELSERAVRESLSHLRLAGVVTITKAAAQHHPTHYRIDVSLVRGARRAGLDDEVETSGVHQVQVSKKSGVHQVQVAEPRPAPGAARPAPRAPNPSVNRQLNQKQPHHAPKNGAL